MAVDILKTDGTPSAIYTVLKKGSIEDAREVGMTALGGVSATTRKLTPRATSVGR
jgi:hypothetical protein